MSDDAASGSGWGTGRIKYDFITIAGKKYEVVPREYATHQVSFTDDGLVRMQRIPDAPDIEDAPVAHGIEQLPARGVIRDAWGRVGELTDRGVHWVRNSIPTTRDSVVFPATILEWGGR